MSLDSRHRYHKNSKLETEHVWNITHETERQRDGSVVKNEQIHLTYKGKHIRTPTSDF